MASLLLFLVVGAVTGVLAGLFGIGGGLIMVPVMVFSFTAHGVAPELIFHMALATSMATIMFTSITSIAAHHKKGAVEWPIVFMLSIGIVAGTFIGGSFVVSVSGEVLAKAIGIFALLVSAKMFFGLNPPSSGNIPGKVGLISAGGVIGFGSAWFGIGGGSFTVPYLTWIKRPMQNAVATSAACGFPIAVSGAITYTIMGWNHPDLPEWSTGYLYWPAIFGMAIASMPMAKVGANLAHKLNPALLKKLFALLLLGLGIKFLFFS